MLCTSDFVYSLTWTYRVNVVDLVDHRLEAVFEVDLPEDAVPRRTPGDSRRHTRRHQSMTVVHPFD